MLLALEAKACMTEHGKARPRLYDELSSSHLTVHGANDAAIAAAFVMVNAATSFISPDRNKWDLSRHDPVVNEHRQPDVTLRSSKRSASCGSAPGPGRRVSTLSASSWSTARTTVPPFGSSPGHPPYRRETIFTTTR